MKLAIGYRRLSTQDQSKYSLQDQEKAIQRYCKDNDLELQHVFTDNGQSSYTFDRSDFKALERFIKEQRPRPDYLIVKTLDRFSRNASEALTKIKELEVKYKLKVLACNEDINLDTDDPTVFIQRAFTFVFANTELLMIRKRTSDGIRSAQLSGRYMHPAPYGYIKPKLRSGGIITVNEEEADMVRFIFREFLHGHPMHQVYDMARANGFRRNGHSTIKNILSNPLYAGLVRVKADSKNKESLVAGKHEAIIRESDYWTVQEKLGLIMPSKTQPKEEFPLRGVLICTCGRNMTACNSRGKNRSYPYYLCPAHRNKSYNATKLGEQIEELLGTISFTVEQLDYIEVQCKKHLKEATAATTKKLNAHKDQLAEVRQEMEVLEEKYLKKKVNDEFYGKWHSRLEIRESLAMSQVRETSEMTYPKAVERLNNELPKLKNLRTIYRNAGLADKHKLLRQVFEHGLTYSDGRYRTPGVSGLFAPNLLLAKEKGLLEVDETLRGKAALRASIPARNRTEMDF